jgi:hypothetical protein
MELPGVGRGCEGLGGGGPSPWAGGTTRYLPVRGAALLLGWRWPPHAPEALRLAWGGLLLSILLCGPALAALCGERNATARVCAVAMGLPALAFQACGMWKVGGAPSSADHIVAAFEADPLLSPTLRRIVRRRALVSSLAILGQGAVLGVAGSLGAGAPQDAGLAALALASACLGGLVVGAMLLAVSLEARLLRLLIERAGALAPPPSSCIANHLHVRDMMAFSRDRWGLALALGGSCWTGVAILYLYSLALTTGRGEQALALALSCLATSLAFHVIYVLASASAEAGTLLSRTVDARIADTIERGSPEECARLGLLVQYSATGAADEVVYTVLSVPVTFGLIGRIVPFLVSAAMIAARQVLTPQAQDAFYYLE